LIDEGTSALDKDAELDVLSLISELDKSITAILIAHSKTVLSAVETVLQLHNAVLSTKPASEVQEDEL
jgi:ABC-type bacteriocin/lantibiotic exporter with double-glycine peptidase domain